MYLKPFAWIPEGAFCRNRENDAVFIKIAMCTTLLLEYPSELSIDDIADIIDEFVPDDIIQSKRDPTIIWMRNPVMTEEYTVEGKLCQSATSIPTCASTGEEIMTNDKWINSRIDPEGVLASFWRARNLNPYGWMLVKEYKALDVRSLTKTNRFYKRPSDQSICISCSIEIMANENDIFPADNIVIEEVGRTVLFWDIESISPSRQFTDPTKPEDRITLISVIIDKQNSPSPTAYILTTEDVNEKLVPEVEIKLNIIHYSSEAELIMGFFGIWMSSDIDSAVYYNGDSYDMPYLIERMKINNIDIPFLGRMAPLKTNGIMEIKIPTPFGRETKSTFDAPGVEIIDLTIFYRRFYPGMINYKLETIGNKFLGEGKTGLDVETMFSIIESMNRDMMAKVVWYSYKDTLLLYRLWSKYDVNHIISSLCNFSGCTSEELLRMSDKLLVRRLINNIDPSTSIGDFTIKKKIPYIKVAKKGFYTNISIYSYEHIILRAFEMLLENIDIDNPGRQYVTKVFDSIKEFPCRIQGMVLNSTAFYGSNLSKYMNQLLDLIPELIAVDEDYFYCKSNNSLDDLFGAPRQKYILYAHFGSGSSIAVVNPSTLIRFGSNKICRYKYEYIRIIVDDYLMKIINGKDPRGKKIDPNDIESMSSHLLTLTSKVKSLDHYSGKKETIQYTLAKIIAEKGIVVKTWLSVKYLYTINGVYLVEKDEDYVSRPKLDSDKYAKDINSIYSILDSLMV